MIRKFDKDREWQKFHSPKNLSMALAAEAAELMEIFMWLSDNQLKQLPEKFPERLQNAREEIGDIFLYLVRVAEVLNIDLFDAVFEKFSKIEQKYPIEKSRELSRLTSET